MRIDLDKTKIKMLLSWFSVFASEACYDIPKDIDLAEALNGYLPRKEQRDKSDFKFLRENF